MRLLVVGRLSGQLATAVKMAMAHGAKVSHVERGDQATEQLRRGQGADLLMVDYRIDIAGLIAANEAERIHVPVVACGVDADASDARLPPVMGERAMIASGPAGASSATVAPSRSRIARVRTLNSSWVMDADMRVHLP